MVRGSDPPEPDRRPSPLQDGVPAKASDDRETHPATSFGRGDADIATAVVETAFEAIGSPYKWGGTSANGFDCSGLIQYAYGQYGIDLPRISRHQLGRGTPVEVRVEALEPGDVLGFSAVVGGEPTHVGLYVGDGRFIHSGSSGVKVSDLREPYWQRHFMAARRMVS
jgi:cell wall-associated NlpC family hydrolase